MHYVPTVTFSAAEQHHSLTSNKLCCSMTEAEVCKQLTQSRYMTVKRPGVKYATSWSQVWRLDHYTTKPHRWYILIRVICRLNSGLHKSTQAASVVSQKTGQIGQEIMYTCHPCKRPHTNTIGERSEAQTDPAVRAYDALSEICESNRLIFFSLLCKG